MYINEDEGSVSTEIRRFGFNTKTKVRYQHKDEGSVSTQRRSLVITQRRTPFINMVETDKKIDVKFKLLQYACRSIKEIMERHNEREMHRLEKLIQDSLEEIYALKYKAIEEKLINEEDQHAIDHWTADIQDQASVFEEHLEKIAIELYAIQDQEIKKKIREAAAEDERRMQKTYDEEKRIEMMRLEVKRELKAEVTKKEMSTKPKSVAKLPKLEISKFKGNHIDWFRFWNQFSAEIDGADIAQVTKFSYLKEMLPPQAKSLVDGLPFDTEGYERAKSILNTKYGKTSEVVNAHVQAIMNLPTIPGTNPIRIHNFYEKLVTHVQSLETMGKLNEINGYVRSTLDKLSGIRSDLVRLDENWQNWKFAQLIQAVLQWTERNPVPTESMRPEIYLRKKTEKAYTSQQNKQSNVKCAYCNKEEHKTNNCEAIKDVSERKKILSKKQLCFNCTKTGHRASDCKSRSCYNCNGRHHTSICDKTKKADEKTPVMCSPSSGSVIFPIAVVMVNGIKCRALIDTGSGSSYVSSRIVDLMKIKPSRRESKTIEMLMHTASTKVEIYEVEVTSTSGDFTLKTEVSKIEREPLLKVRNPKYQNLLKSYQHLKGVTMEDQDRKAELPVHMILGANLYSRIKMEEAPRIGNNGDPVAELTRFGWVLMSPGAEIENQIYLTNTVNQDYDRLCRLDVLGIEDKPEGDQNIIYEEFKEQLTRDEEGWYETGLLWRPGHEPLKDNKEASIGRLNNLIKRLKRDPALFEEYDQKIKDQIEEGIVEEAPKDPEGIEFYIPHKPVVRETAESTKLRIVYDASAKPNEQSPSLNECLETGPPMQKHLWNILVRNRLRPVVITGDIKQAFLQIRIRKEFRDVLRFHWIKDKSTQDLQVLRFTRAVFGVGQSPFLLGGTLNTHLDKYTTEEFAEIIEEIKENLYVDDVIGGAETQDEAKTLKEQTIKILGDAKFVLHKWHSNIRELEDCSLKDEDEEQTYAKQQMNVKKDESAILGVKWNKNEDSIAVTFPVRETEVTKRGVLQYVASIYDPLGLVSPIVLRAKILYREICDRKLGWDRQLTDDLRKLWLAWKQHLPEVIKVPRPISNLQEKIERVVLHAFADASKEGTSVALYAVIHQGSKAKQGLLASKSRLSKKNLSIPRLELVAAHMASNILENASRALKVFPVSTMVAWSDSTVVLHWIKGSGQYKQFVHNRVSKIKSKSDIEWRHVSTKQNPSDVGSRGCSGNHLKEEWFKGPAWLKDELQWPENFITSSSIDSEVESKKIKEVMNVAVEDVEDKMRELLNKFSLWKVIRITCWMRRFIKNCRAKSDESLKGPLSTNETEEANIVWIKRTQAAFENTERFHEDKERLNLQRDYRGIYVCMGRIEGEYPIYLPSKNVFSEKVVQNAHMRTLHGGAGFTITEVRRNFWIPRLRQIAKAVIYRCHGCKRFTTKAFHRPRPGNLPPDRTQGNKPFQVVGVDFAGPFIYKKDKRSTGKAYILLYTCSLTRAVYLDLLPSQSLDELLNSIKEFIARRSRPNKIYSDNFSSFVAASKWLKRVWKEEKLQDFLSKMEIKWQFNLSRAPWWGGQFERMVGLMKQSLFKVLGKSSLTMREMKSILLDVETTLNNRPLGYIEDDIQSVILTPNVMMFDQPVVIPEMTETDDDGEQDLKKRYKHLRACKDRIWRRWTDEYVRQLRERHNLKHNTKEMNLTEGDVVIIKGDEKNRSHWKTGIVERLINGRDNVVRAIRLRAGKSYLERPVEHLYPLELHCNIKKPEETIKLNPTANEFKSKRDASTIARILINDQYQDDNDEH